MNRSTNPSLSPNFPGEAAAAISTDHPHRALSALPRQGPHLPPPGKETDALPPASPLALPPGLQPRTQFPAQVHRPYPETQRPARSSAQRNAAHGRGLAGCAGGCGLAVRGWRAGGLARGERGAQGATGRGRGSPVRPRRSPRPPATHVRPGWSPWSRSGTRRQVRPTYSTPGASGRAGRRASKRAGEPGGERAAAPAGRTDAAEGPTWRSPGAPREAETAEARRAPKESPGWRRGRGSATASPRPRAAVAAQGGPRALRAGELAARGRRRLTGGTARRSSRRSWNRSGREGGAPLLSRATAGRAEPGSPQRRSTCNGPPGFGEGRGAAPGPPPGAFRVADASGNFMEVSRFLSRPPPPRTARETAVERVGRGKQRSLRLRQGATD